MIIIQPHPSPASINVEIDGNLILSEELEEPNFREVLLTARKVINSVTKDGLYQLERQIIIPTEEGCFHYINYESIDDWLDDHLPFSVDQAVLKSFAERVRAIVKSSRYTVTEYFREEITILVKI